MADGIAPTVVDTAIKTSDLTKPVKVGRKLIGLFEMAGGGMLSGMVDKALKEWFKTSNVNPTFIELGQLILSMVGSGMINQSDFKNVLGGMSAASASQIGARLYSILMGATGGLKTDVQKSAITSGSQSMIVGGANSKANYTGGLY